MPDDYREMTLILGRQRVTGGPLDWPRPGIAEFRILGQAAQDSDGQVVTNLNLTGEPTFRRATNHSLQARLFGGRNWTCISVNYLYSAGGAAGIPAASVKDVDPGVLYRKNQAPAVLGSDNGVDSFEGYVVHSPVLCVIPNVSADSKLVSVRKFRGVRSLKQELTYVAVTERPRDKRISNALLVESAFSVEDLLAQPAEYVVRKLIGAE
jgi:hypothetical protein